MLTRGVVPAYDPENFGQMHQLHVNVERIRVPEALFQPSIIGLDQAGVVETIGDIVNRFDYDEQRKMIKVKNSIKIFSYKYILRLILFVLVCIYYRWTYTDTRTFASIGNFTSIYITIRCVFKDNSC
jgi:putative lipoic acid-binding regulatory protein